MKRGKWIKRFLHFTHRERNGLIVFIFLVIALDLISRYQETKPVPVPASFFTKIEEVDSVLDQNRIDQSSGEANSISVSLSPFDPNNHSVSELIERGVPAFLARNIVRYRQAGGTYGSAEDIRKIYGMNDSLWQVLSPYIQYPKSVKDDIAVSNELSFKPFDPNAISRDTLVAWGLSEDVAERWVRFREGGKVFKNSEDLLDVFGMVQEWVDHMAPLAQWPAEKTVEQDSVTETVHRKVRKVEINSADSLSLIQVPGIGGYTASKILKLREEMGGFYTLSQIREIYGLRPENFELISKYTFVDRSFIRQININSAPIEEMASHPYISESVAREIEKFRVEFRSFERLDEIQKLYAVDSALYEKIKPYLTLQSK